MTGSKTEGAVLSPRRFSRAALWIAGVLIAFCLGVTANAADSAHPYQKWADALGIDLDVSYDGIRVMEFRGGTFEAVERRAPGKMYSEVHMGNMTSGVILREDLEKSYILMPSMGYYKEDSLKGGMLQSSNGMQFSKIEKVGKEDINGHPSSKYKTRFKDNEGKGAGFVWVTDTGVPIKMDMIYSNKDLKGERIMMQFTELNLREQDPAVFELPPNLKPMGMSSLGDIMKMGAQQQGTDSTATAPAATGGGDLSSRQQACLEEAAKAAEEKDAASKKTKGFGRLMGKVARTANRLGISNKLHGVSRDIYDANATTADVEDIAGNLGITTEDVERCRNAS